MKLVLQVNKRVVAGDVKSDVAQHTGNNTRAHFLSLCLHNNFLQVIALVLDSEPRELLNAEINAEGFSNALDAE